MVSLPRFFHTTTSDELITSSSSPSIPSELESSTRNDNMTRRSSSSMPILGNPGSLKAVFGASDPRDPTMADEYVDDIVPEFIQCSIMGSNAAFGRRSRLDDSAGEGLRRNVLVRNAMLSSLERERRQMAEEASAYDDVLPTVLTQQNSSASAMDEEAQFFDDLLSELSGSDCSDSASPVLESTAPSNVGPASFSIASKTEDDEEDFVQLEAELPMEPTTIDTPGLVPVPTLLDSCSSAFSANPVCTDSGFAEESSRPASAAGCCTGYPNVCPYPAVSSYVGGSSEELPALIDDDSDVDDDDDEVHDQVSVGPKPSLAVEADPFDHDVATLLSPDGDASHSRPLSPVTSPVQSVCVDFISFRDPLSPEPSRPTSPISSASSKGDGDGPSPLLLPSDLGGLSSLAELSLQLPAATGADLLSRPSRGLTGAWFEHKQEASNGPSTSADRMRWTTSPANYFRPRATAAASTTAPDLQHYRFGIDPHRSSYSAVATNDPADQSIVVHWSH